MLSRRVALQPLLEQIHDAGLGALPWEVALQAIARRFRANSAIISVRLANGDGSGISTAGDSRAHRDYFKHYASIHPLIARTVAAPVGLVMTDRMVMPKREFQRTEFYADWARPNEFDEMLHVRLASGDASMIGMGMTRSRRAGEFEAIDLALVRRLVPHLQRAVATHQRLEGVAASRRTMVDALDRVRRGVLGLDRDSQVVFANRTARSLLAEGGALRIEDGLLATSRCDLTKALRRMVRSAAVDDASGALVVPTRDGGMPLLLEAVPTRNPVAPLSPCPQSAVLLFIDDPENDGASAVASLRKLYALTATEAAVAIHAARGKGLEAVARGLGIAIGTVRSHLKHVFDKTGTHRQAELAWLLARLPG